VYPILRANLKALGLTYRDVGALIGKHESTVGLMMTGRLSFRLDDAMTIRDFVAPGMTLDELFSSQSTPPGGGD
jgi:hypothetical protein